MGIVVAFAITMSKAIKRAIRILMALIFGHGDKEDLASLDI